MSELIAAVQAANEIIDKAGTIGLLVILNGIFGTAAYKLRKELRDVYNDLNRAQALQILYKSVLDQQRPPIVVDTSHITAMFPNRNGQ